MIGSNKKARKRRAFLYSRPHANVLRCLTNTVLGDLVIPKGIPKREANSLLAQFLLRDLPLTRFGKQLGKLWVGGRRTHKLFPLGHTILLFLESRQPMATGVADKLRGEWRGLADVCKGTTPVESDTGGTWMQGSSRPWASAVVC